MINNHVVEEILAYIKQQEASRKVPSRRNPNPRMVFILGVVLVAVWAVL